MAAERALGREPRDVSAAKVGYDIESRDPKTGHLHFIEVKGRIEGGDTITVTTNEMLVSLNAGERFVLAIVPIGDGGFAHQPVYVRRPVRSCAGPRCLLDHLQARQATCREGRRRAEVDARKPRVPPASQRLGD